MHEDGTDFPGHEHPAMVCITTGEPQHDVVMAVHTPDDDLNWISINVEPILEEAQQTGVVCTFRDITAERALRAQLSESEQKYRLLAENSADIIIRIDHGLIEWASPSLTTILGWAPDDWVGRSALTLVHPNDTEELIRAEQLIRSGQTVITRCRLLDKSNGYRLVEGHGPAYHDADGTPRGMMTTVHDVDVEMKALAYEHRARHDALTGLFSRDETVMRLSGILERTSVDGRLTAVAFCDIDEFKSANDEHGHLAGDAVLTAAAQRLSACVRETDHVGRLGGDEILVILDRLRDLDAAHRVASNICDALRHPIATDHGELFVTMSIGVAVARPGEEVDGLLSRADAALSEAKRLGKDRVVVDPT